MPRPTLTPKLRSIHHIAAPAMPAAPVPLDHAPRAVRDHAAEGRVVVIWRKVSSPSPDDRDARAMPNRRGYKVVENAMVCSCQPIMH